MRHRTTLYRARVRGLLTQGELADRASVSIDTVKRAERGERISDLSKEKIARALDAEAEALFPLEEAS